MVSRRSRAVAGVVGGAFLAAGLSGRLESQVPEQLDGVRLELTQVADSGAYFVYAYSLSNPSTSAWSISIAKLDISASGDTPPNLPSTGRVLDASRAGEPHAEVGPVSPNGWGVSLTRGAQLWWYPPSTGRSTSDSVGPGETKSGFGIRSSYLPGISEVVAEPRVEDCCLEIAPGADGDFYPSRSSFPVRDLAVAPRFRPGEVTPQLVRSQLTVVCVETEWIENGAYCDELQALLGDVADQSSTESTLGSLEHLAARIEAERPAMRSSAYWLLSLNVGQLIQSTTNRRR